MKFSLLIPILFLILSCRGRNIVSENIAEEIHIDIENPPLSSLSEHLYISNVFQLETNKNVLLGSIRKITCQFNKYFIHDLQSHSLNVFDFKGNFLNKIGNKGKGPGEFIELRDFSISNDSIIHLLTYRKIILYNLSGKFIKEINIKNKKDYLNPLHIATNKGRTYFLWQGNFYAEEDRKNNSFLLYSISSNGLEVKNQYFPLLRGGLDNVQFRTTYGGITLRPTFGSNVLFKLIEDSLIEYLKVYFTGHQFDEKKLKTGFGDDVIRQILDLRKNSSDCVSIDNFLETDKYYYFTFFQKGKMNQIIYSKETSKYVISEVSLFTDIICTNKNSFVCAIEPTYYNKLLNKLFKKGLIPEDNFNLLKSLIVDIKSNPILVTYKIKDF